MGSFQSGVFFQHFQRRRRKKRQQYFWTSFALYSRRKRSLPTRPAALAALSQTLILRDSETPPRETHVPPQSNPPGQERPTHPSARGSPEPPRPQWTDPAAGGTHWDVGDQPVSPETVPGVGPAGSVGVHQHQHVLLALQERRTLWARSVGQGACTGSTAARSSPPGVLRALQEF